MAQNGLLVIVSGPSGTGKGTLLNALKQKNDNIVFSVSATTRKPRQGEIEGQNYFFKSIDEFKNMIENNELIEWDKYCDNYYGTPKKFVEDSLNKGLDVILEITVEGALNIKHKYPESVSVFILPPSFKELKKRIEGRGTENADVIQKRLATALKEIMYVNKFEYVVINDDIETAVNNINSILVAEKSRVIRNANILKQLECSMAERIIINENVNV